MSKPKGGWPLTLVAVGAYLIAPEFLAIYVVIAAVVTLVWLLWP